MTITVYADQKCPYCHEQISSAMMENMNVVSKKCVGCHTPMKLEPDINGVHKIVLTEDPT